MRWRRWAWRWCVVLAVAVTFSGVAGAAPWDLNTTIGESASVWGADLDPTGDYLAYSLNAGDVEVVDQGGGWGSVASFTEPDRVETIEFSPDGQFLAYGTAFASDEIVVRSVGGAWGEVLRTGAGGDVLDVSWSSDYLAVATDARQVEVYHRGNWTLKETISQGGEHVRFSPDGQFMAVSWMPENVVVYDTADFSIEASINSWGEFTGPVVWSEDYIGFTYDLSADTSVAFFERGTWESAVNRTDPAATSRGAGGMDGWHVFGANDGEVLIYGADTTLNTTLQETTMDVRDASMSPGWLVYPSFDDTVYIHNRPEAEPEPGRVNGSVVRNDTGGAVEGATVTVQGVGNATTDAAGAYAVEDVPPGEYVVEADHPDYMAAVRNVTVLENMTATADFMLEPLPGSVSGRVTDQANSAPVFGANVSIVEGGAVVAEDLSNTQGRYSLDDVPPGTYVVRAEAAGFRPAERSVQVGPGEDVDDVNFALQSIGIGAGMAVLVFLAFAWVVWRARPR